ncbi:MAG: hypothetical protein ABWW70_01850 [Thermoproteota archaeon]
MIKPRRSEEGDEARAKVRPQQPCKAGVDIMIAREDLVSKILRRIKERWPRAAVTRIKVTRSKLILYLNLDERDPATFVKLIIYADGRIRSYGKGGLPIAVRNVARRVLGVE